MAGTRRSNQFGAKPGRFRIGIAGSFPAPGDGNPRRGCCGSSETLYESAGAASSQDRLESPTEGDKLNGMEKPILRCIQ